MHSDLVINRVAVLSGDAVVVSTERGDDSDNDFGSHDKTKLFKLTLWFLEKHGYSLRALFLCSDKRPFLPKFWTRSVHSSRMFLEADRREKLNVVERRIFFGSSGFLLRISLH